MDPRMTKPSLRKQTVRKRPRAPRNAFLAFLRRHAIVILAIGVLALVVHDVFGDHGFLAMRRNQKQAEKLQQEIQQLDQENQRITGEVEALKTDPRAIERIAREQMGLAKPGEYVIRLPEAPKREEKPASKK